MKLLRFLERVLAVVDWVAAGLLTVAAVIVLYIGITAGLIVYTDKRTLGGHEWTLAFGALLLILAALCALAAVGMRDQAWWRWYAQLAPIPAYIIGFTLTLCLSGTTVRLTHAITICGK